MDSNSALEHMSQIKSEGLRSELAYVMMMMLEEAVVESGACWESPFSRAGRRDHRRSRHS